MQDPRLPRPAIRPEFRSRLRAQLTSEAVRLAEERRRRRGWPSVWSGWLRPALAVATVALVLALGTGVAAAGSLPGDAGYPLKRAVEEAQLALAPTDQARVEILASHAQRRLEELAKTVQRADRAPTASAEYEAALKRFAEAVEKLRAAEPGTKRDAVTDVVDAARERHLPVLEQLKERLPTDARQGIERAIEQHEKLERGKPSSPPGKPAERPTRTGEREGPRATASPRGGRP